MKALPRSFYDRDTLVKMLDEALKVAAPVK